MIAMLANYANDPTLFKRCIRLIDSVFPGVENVAMTGMKYDACWDKISLPFIVEDNGEVIAHLGLIPLELMLNHQKRKVAAIHGICVKPEFRGRGLFKQLMREALTYIANHFSASLLFTDKPDLYHPYHFLVLPEYDYRVNSPGLFQKKKSDLRVLELDNTHDLQIMHDLLANRLPLSKQLSLLNESTIFTLDNLNKKIYFSAQLNAIIIYQIVDQTLYLKDIVAERHYQLNEIIEKIPENFDKIILQFCPDQFNAPTTPVLANPECSIMVSQDFNFEGEFFRYPEPYRC